MGEYQRGVRQMLDACGTDADAVRSSLSYLKLKKKK